MRPVLARPPLRGASPSRQPDAGDRSGPEVPTQPFLWGIMLPTQREAAVATVLVVDDDEGVRTTVCQLLESAGFDTEAAEDGEQALARLGPDIDGMVLDLHMPKLGGIRVLDALDEGPIVIILSAFQYLDRDEVEARYAERVCAFLSKPVPPPILIATVKQCLEDR